jgi:hypothetical protein
VAKIEKVEGEWVESGTLRVVIVPPVLVPV